MSTPDNGLTCECGHGAAKHVSGSVFSATIRECWNRAVLDDRCPCREFKSAEVGRLTKLLADWDIPEGNFDNSTLAGRYFNKACAWGMAETKLDHAILRAIGVVDPDSGEWPCEDIWYDEYDGSFELGDVEVGFTLTPEMGAEIAKTGLNHGWLNFKDGTAKHYQGPTWAGSASNHHAIPRNGKREIAALKAALIDATRICDKAGCTAAVVRKDDGSRYCASGHDSRWVDAADVAALKAENAKLAAVIERFRRLAFLSINKTPEEIANHYEDVGKSWAAENRELRDKLAARDGLIEKFLNAEVASLNGGRKTWELRTEGGTVIGQARWIMDDDRAEARRLLAESKGPTDD